jgi:nitrogenase subunit NifH
MARLYKVYRLIEQLIRAVLGHNPPSGLEQVSPLVEGAINLLLVKSSTSNSYSSSQLDVIQVVCRGCSMPIRVNNHVQTFILTSCT